MAGAVDWREVRALFPATEGQAYLNTASYGPGPTPVAEAVERALREWSTGRGSWRAWDEVGEEARAGFARLLGCATNDVALLPAFSVAAGQVAEGLPYTEGANLVVGEEEFQSNLFPWLGQARRGFEVRRVPFRDGRLDVGQLARAVDGRTACVAVSHVQSASGYRVDLERLVEVCRRHGARLFLDATQSAGALRVPLEGVDYLATAAYKWLLAPRGAAFLYVAPGRAAELAPIVPNWKTTGTPYASYYGPPYEPPPDARRFDVSLGWLPWIGAAAGLRLLLELGIDAIEARDLELARAFREGLRGVGLEASFAEAESSQIVGLRVPDPEKVKARLREGGVVAAVRGAFVRVAFHFFNDESDVERALKALG